MKFVLALIALVGLTTSLHAAQGSQDIAHDQMVQIVAAQSAVIIDANGTASYTRGHIPGAIDFQANHQDLAAVLPADKNTQIIAYCGGPRCSAHAAATRAATQLGYTNVAHYSQGIAGWVTSGQQLATASTTPSSAP